MTQPQQQSPADKHIRLLKKLVFTTVCMFGFGFALVPLYDVFCDVTGLNGKTNNVAAEASFFIDDTRKIKVEFIARTQGSLNWQFQPETNQLEVHPGQTHQLNFLVKNNSIDNMVVQAVPSVSPGQAATYFHKIECFCFNQQPLKQGQTADLGLQFYIDKELPEEYSTVTLSYTLFDITDKVAETDFEQLFAVNDQAQ